MIKINGFGIEHWNDNLKRWYVSFPDDSGLSFPDRYSISLVLRYVLFWIQNGRNSVYDL